MWVRLENNYLLYVLPESYEDFVLLLCSYTIKDQSILLERMLKCNHPTLSGENKAKAEVLFKFLIQLAHDIAEEAETENTGTNSKGRENVIVFCYGDHKEIRLTEKSLGSYEVHIKEASQKTGKGVKFAFEQVKNSPEIYKQSKSNAELKIKNQRYNAIPRILELCKMLVSMRLRGTSALLLRMMRYLISFRNLGISMLTPFVSFLSQDSPLSSSGFPGHQLIVRSRALTNLVFIVSDSVKWKPRKDLDVWREGKVETFSIEIESGMRLGQRKIILSIVLFRLVTFEVYLFHYFSLIDNRLSLLPNLNMIMFEIINLIPMPCCTALREVISEHFDNSKGKKVKTPIPLNVIIFLKIVGMLCPASDFKHPVTTPALILCTQLLENSSVTSFDRVARGLMLSAILVESALAVKIFW
ncbi:hypothetical protein QYM36_011420 [Artemia franciscana]|uniref:Uncharacterized protein n=1 Tax=Artemia franciscana TaxID=6661 RepID=A0AA88L1A0_ARTSF|nr:hypothetical protein QYM36_011420 [Artemia franciscana]